MTTAVLEAPELEAPEVDPEAPYGRKPDGTPYTMSPEQRAEMGRRLTEGRRKAALSGGSSGRRKTGSSATGSSARTGTDYREGVKGILQIPAFGLGMAGRFRPEFALDSAALTLHAPNIAEALDQAARDNPTVAAVLDRVLAVGPYGALLGAVLPLALQLAANHGKVPTNPDMGILPPDQLVAALESVGSRK